MSTQLVTLANAPLDKGGLAYKLADRVAPQFDTTAAHVLSTSRRPNVAAARHVVCWVMYELGFPSVAIGRHLCRDHTTVLSSIRQVNRTPELLAAAEAARDVWCGGVAA